VFHHGQVPLKLEQSLPDLVNNLPEDWAEDADLKSCYNYARRSKYVTIPKEWEHVFSLG
jgi:hypothetical protein